MSMMYVVGESRMCGRRVEEYVVCGRRVEE